MPHIYCEAHKVQHKPEFYGEALKAELMPEFYAPSNGGVQFSRTVTAINNATA